MTAAEDEGIVSHWIEADPIRWHLLSIVRDLQLPDCWIGAGFVRDAVWARIHGAYVSPDNDVDVIWHDLQDCRKDRDKQIEAELCRIEPRYRWSVKNQARMHLRNGDGRYSSSQDAMRFWPETATAVGVRRSAADTCEIIAPFGLDDLLSLHLRPAGKFAGEKRHIFDARVQSKRWLDRFPLLRLTT